jgi:SAM-dependent methyltransferase
MRSKATAFGDFSAVAQLYLRRPPYSNRIVSLLTDDVKRHVKEPRFVDIGAGTGKLANALAERGLTGYAIEPDAAMVEVGRRASSSAVVDWIKASGEQTTLPKHAVDWVSYSSSFHWTNAAASLTEALRILRPGGFFTIVNHLADLAGDPLHMEIENSIGQMAPGLKRARPPLVAVADTLEATLNHHPGFGSCVIIGEVEKIPMTGEDYVSYWAGSHDVPSQVSAALWADILAMVARTFAKHAPPHVRFRTTAWHTRRRD